MEVAEYRGWGFREEFGVSGDPHEVLFFDALDLVLISVQGVALHIGEVPHVLSQSERVLCYSGYLPWIFVTLFGDELYPTRPLFPSYHFFKKFVSP